jgi:hypothetical protein
MKFKASTLATAVIASLATCAFSVQAATPPALQTRLVGSGTSTATFAGGASINAGVNFLSAIPANSGADIVANIVPAAADVGKEADIYMVINAGSTWYMRTSTGFSVWDTKLASLVPYATTTLSASQPVSATDLEALVGTSFDGSTLRVHVGYMTDTSPLTYSSAIQFAMSSAPSSTCPAGTTQRAAVVLGGKQLCVLSGTYTTPLHLTYNFDYILSGAVFIGGDNTNNSSITIDPDTTVYGESGLDFLVINRGSKIHANGSSSKPVTMTSANDLEATSTTRGQWGGVIINGNAPINGCTEGTTLCEASGEGSTGLYGGTNPADDSGNMNYLVVKYAGYNITPENELNGIAFQGVGNGTLVDYVQVHNNSDDGVEFFGGTVNAKHLYLSGNEDDSLDWTFGWNGKVQHVVILAGSDIGDQGIEADNNSSNRDSTPRSQPVISNMTMIGSSNADTGILLREGTGANLRNVIIKGYGDDCIDIDHSATFVNAGTSATALSGNLTMTNSVVECTTNFREESGDNFTVQAWFEGQAGNVATSTGMTSYINSAVVNALTPATQTDSFFDQTTYVGAVKDSASDWTAGWTFTD